MPDAIKRTADNVFWTEWAAVTAHTRELLLMYAEHSIMLTVNPQKLAKAIHQADIRRQRKKAADRSNSHNRQKVESIAKFPPLIIP